MIKSVRAGMAVAVLAVGVLALGGCGVPAGLRDGGTAPPVAAQPSPQPLWPDWDGIARKRPGPAVSAPRPAPTPLSGIRVPGSGLAGIDPAEVLRADPRAKVLGKPQKAARPGQPGLRPPVLRDLTGDGQPELILSADLDSGRTAMAVYTARDGEVVPVLHIGGKLLGVETVGTDLVVRSAADDGAEQAVRYRWDGARLSSVSDIRTYQRDDEEDAPEPEDGP
ncbi:hypothetical protein ACFWXK_14505 [Streptomyces sp. NPDC059070]|uniref:hypothetical protein n=1 Tax=Streptomyces sp. NPDC059070 TaxID=3346713 RepID=UPI0036B95541